MPEFAISNSDRNKKSWRTGIYVKADAPNFTEVEELIAKQFGNLAE
jgi:hypothetical protein